MATSDNGFTRATRDQVTADVEKAFEIWLTQAFRDNDIFGNFSPNKIRFKNAVLNFTATKNVISERMRVHHSGIKMIFLTQFDKIKGTNAVTTNTFYDIEKYRKCYNNNINRRIFVNIYTKTF